jgi:DNA-binding CsgD family transcriptional regulator
LHELRPGTVVLVDDADDLDAVTTGVLGSAHALTGVPVVVSRRLPSELTGEIQGLVGGLQPGVRIVMPLLPYDELYGLVHEVLGSQVDPMTVARIATESGGLPGLAHAIAIVGRRKGVIREVDGVWTAVGSLWMPELAHTVSAMLTTVSARDVNRLAALAAHGVVDLDMALGVVSPKHLASLQRAGFVKVREASAGSQVDVFPPILGACLRSTHPTYQSFGPVGRTAAPRSLAAAPGHGAQPSDDAVLSRMLAAQGKAWTAQLRAEWERDPTATTAVPLLVSLFATELLSDELDTVYRLTDSTQGTVEDRARFMAWNAIGRAAFAHDARAGAPFLDVARATIPEEAAYFAGVEDHLRFVFDRVPEDAARTTSGLVGLARQIRETVLLEIAIARGSVAEAQTLIDGFTPQKETFIEQRDTCHGLALVLQGSLGEAAARSLDRIQVAWRERNADAVIAQSYVAALSLAIAGRFREMNEVLSAVLTVTSVPVLQTFMHAGIRGLTALGAFWQGRETYSRLLAAEARMLGRFSGPYPAMHAGEAPAGSGCRSDADVWAAADDRLDRGYAAAGVFAAVEAVEQTRSGMVEHRVRELASGVDGPLLEALLTYGEAICSRDVEALETVADVFLAMGANLYATRARISRALALREQGSLSVAVADIDLAWELASGFGVPATGLFTQFTASLEISSREAEIVQLLAGGLSTADIAASITVSTRTVENHILSVYRKVGLDSRAELRRVARTWLSQALRIAGAQSADESGELR